MKILSNGIDIVEVQRIKQIYQKWGKKFLCKVLTENEIYLLHNKAKAFYQFLAARLAAKEATYKAINSFNKELKPGWRDIEVFNEESGSPQIKFRSRCLPQGSSIILSISHTHNYALASAILVEE